MHAIRVLQDKKECTLDSLISAAYDSYLTWFERPIPTLIKAWDGTPSDNPLKAKTAQQIDALRGWDLRWGAASVPWRSPCFGETTCSAASARTREKLAST